MTKVLENHSLYDLLLIVFEMVKEGWIPVGDALFDEEYEVWYITLYFPLNQPTPL